MGVIPESIKEFESVAAAGVVGEERVVGSMHERKMMMAENADGLFACFFLCVYVFMYMCV